MTRTRTLTATASKATARLIKAVAYLRKNAGLSSLSGLGAGVGFAIALCGCHAGWPPEKLSLSLLCVAGFTCVMILLQRFEKWIQGGG